MNEVRESAGALDTIIGQLDAMVAGKRQERAKKDEFKEQALRIGYTENDYKMFCTLLANLDDIINAGGCAAAIATNTDHLPSATFAVAVAVYADGAAHYMYDMLNRCGTDPSGFGLRDNPSEFYAELTKQKAEVQKIIDKHKFAQEAAQG